MITVSRSDIAFAFSRAIRTHFHGIRRLRPGRSRLVSILADGPPASRARLARARAGQPGEGQRRGGREHGIISRGLLRHAERARINASTARTAGTPAIVLRAYPYSVWECTGRFILGTACAFPGPRGFRCQQVYGMECGLAGGAERRPGSQGTDLDEHPVSYLSIT